MGRRGHRHCLAGRRCSVKLSAKDKLHPGFAAQDFSFLKSGERHGNVQSLL